MTLTENPIIVVPSVKRRQARRARRIVLFVLFTDVAFLSLAIAGMLGWVWWRSGQTRYSITRTWFNPSTSRTISNSVGTTPGCANFVRVALANENPRSSLTSPDWQFVREITPTTWDEELLNTPEKRTFLRFGYSHEKWAGVIDSLLSNSVSSSSSTLTSNPSTAGTIGSNDAAIAATGIPGMETTAVCVPLWFLIALFLVLPAAWFVSLRRRLRQAHRRRLGECLRCGYDLRAGPSADSRRQTRCPECGTETEAEERECVTS